MFDLVVERGWSIDSDGSCTRRPSGSIVASLSFPLDCHSTEPRGAGRVPNDSFARAAIIDELHDDGLFYPRRAEPLQVDAVAIARLAVERL